MSQSLKIFDLLEYGNLYNGGSLYTKKKHNGAWITEALLVPFSEDQKMSNFHEKLKGVRDGGGGLCKKTWHKNTPPPPPPPSFRTILH